LGGIGNLNSNAYCKENKIGMRNLIVIIQNEFRHFARNSFKTVSLILFIGAAVYGLQNGYGLLKKHRAEISSIKTKNAETVQRISGWFDEGKTSPDDRPWIDVSTPFWAIWNAPATAVKSPSTLMPFTIGQTEQFGNYKQVTNWSSTFDSDLAEEIANPERLTTGTLDFSFVVLYLLPVLVIVLLFNIGGLEKDLGFDRLIQVTHISQRKWLLARFAFYFFALIIVLLTLMLPYAILTGAFQNEFGTFIKLFSYVAFYMLLWFVVFYFINLSGKGSANQALKMVAVWLLFCIVLPGSIHQIASLKYPASYMTDYINAKRDETYKLWDLPTDSVRNRLLVLYPELAKTKHGKDTIADKDIIDNSSSGLVNELMKNTALAIENNSDDKNRFIQKTYWINPVGFFQNKINALANNDYYAYKQFRNNIQSKIDKKVNAILFDCWNKKTVNKEKYLRYVENFNK
jgi:ABC-2 type transport system permease protein